MNPITIDLSGLRQQFGLSAEQVDQLTQQAIREVTAAIYANWEALAKRKLHSTLPDYLKNLNVIDRGRFEKQIALSGILPVMIESGASPFDIKEGFKKSRKVKYTIPVYNTKGRMVSPGGDWYLTIPFRIGVPGTLGQAGFAGVMPEAVYDAIRNRPRGSALQAQEIPSPYEQLGTRQPIYDASKRLMYDAYTHKNSIYDGLSKRTGVYNTTQNTYGTFRRAGANSDPMSWIHKGFAAYKLAEQAIENTDVETIVENETINFLETIL